MRIHWFYVWHRAALKNTFFSHANRFRMEFDKYAVRRSRQRSLIVTAQPTSMSSCFANCLPDLFSWRIFVLIEWNFSSFSPMTYHSTVIANSITSTRFAHITTFQPYIAKKSTDNGSIFGSLDEYFCFNCSNMYRNWSHVSPFVRTWTWVPNIADQRTCFYQCVWISQIDTLDTLNWNSNHYEGYSRSNRCTFFTTFSFQNLLLLFVRP